MHANAPVKKYFILLFYFFDQFRNRLWILNVLYRKSPVISTNTGGIPEVKLSNGELALSYTGLDNIYLTARLESIDLDKDLVLTGSEIEMLSI